MKCLSMNSIHTKTNFETDLKIRQVPKPNMTIAKNCKKILKHLNSDGNISKDILAKYSGDLTQNKSHSELH